MNIWAKLSLACIPFALLTLWYGTTLEMNESNEIVWIIFIFTPIVGILLAFAAKKPIQIVFLVSLNISYYPMWWLYLTFFANPLHT